jgi:hypothetical protein
LSALNWSLFQQTVRAGERKTQEARTALFFTDAERFCALSLHRVVGKVSGFYFSAPAFRIIP